MQNFAPIALFVYNRPEHTRRTLKFLSQNILADESRLFIFSDGPKTAQDNEKVQEVRDLVRVSADKFKSVEIIERPLNAGLANSIVQGVTQLLKEYGKVIVFEDDLISSPHTLQYFNTALKKYQHNEKVMHIGAYMYPIQGAKLPETFFYRVVTSWGWATWDRAWNAFEPDIEKLVSQFDREKIHRFSVEGTMNFWKQMLEFRSGKNNSWAIRWYASVFLAGGLSLHPSRSLVNNIGHDGSGMHSGTNEVYQVPVNQEEIREFPVVVEENEAAHVVIRAFLKNRKGSLLQRIVRFLRGGRG